MSDKKTPMDQAAKAKIMSNEYKSNDGKATDWSKRAQRAADRNQGQPAQQSDGGSGKGGSGVSSPTSSLEGGD